jgi:hypothetical protein
VLIILVATIVILAIPWGKEKSSSWTRGINFYIS